jgi:selenocysteine lyase/cysteine desulfurase
MSRRQFLGGSMAAAVGSMSVGLYEERLAAQLEAAIPLSGLRAPAMLDENYWWRVRTQFNMVDGLTFMNNGTAGPMARVVFEENVKVLREIAEDPKDNYRRDGIQATREKLAPFIGADVDEVAFMRSTTEGMNVFAHGLDWKEGDEVLVCNHEHGGGLGPYRSLEQRRGIKINTIEVPSPFESVDQIVDLYRSAMTPRTRVIMVSHMPYVTGTVMPIKELADLAHSQGALISVDGAHPPGMLDLNMHASGVDHYAGAGQKWLCAGTGTGIMYIKKDVQAQVWPLMGGPYREESGSASYESYGQRNIPSLMGIGTAIDLNTAIGKKNIEDRDRQLGSRLRAGLKEIPGVKLWTPDSAELACGLTLFSIRDIPMNNIVAAIREHGRIHIRTMGTGNLNAVRASTALYNMPEEVDRLLESVRYVSEHSADYMSSAQ